MKPNNTSSEPDETPIGKQSSGDKRIHRRRIFISQRAIAEYDKAIELQKKFTERFHAAMQEMAQEIISKGKSGKP